MIAFRQIFAFVLLVLASHALGQQTQAEQGKPETNQTRSGDGDNQTKEPENGDRLEAENPAKEPANAKREEARQVAEEAADEEDALEGLDELPDAPPGIILGQVLTSSTGEPIGAARVKIVETNQNTMTDNQGRFRFDKIPMGNYTLEFYAVGYQASTESTVVDDLGGSPIVATLLAVGEEANDIYSLDTFDFLEEYEEPEETNQLSLKLAEGASLRSGLGREEFATSGISDAGDAVGKLVGANVVGGKYAVVRGLGDRYTNTLVNGAQIASADPSKKAVQLDLFPSNLLQGVNIYKTFTPNLPADFAGGLIAIDTLRFPEERILEASFGYKVRENLSDTDYFAIEEGRLDFLGGGTPNFRGSLDQFAPNEIPRGDPDGRPGAVVAEEFRRDLLEGGFLADRAATPDLFNHSLTYGDSFQISEDSKIGVVMAWTHTSDANAQPNIALGRATIDARGIALGREAVLNQFSEDINFGLLGSVAFQLNKNHEINATYFQSTNRSNQITQVRRDESDAVLVENDGNLTSINIDGVDTPAVAFGAGDQLQFLERELKINQFSGRHSLPRADGRKGISVEWTAAFTDAIEDRPDSREFYFSALDFTDSRLSNLPNFNPGLGESVLIGGDKQDPAENGRSAQRNSLQSIDEGINYSAQAEIPFYFGTEGDNRFSLSFGVNHNDRSRVSNGRALRVSASGQLTSDFRGNDDTAIDAINNLDDLSQIDGGRIASIVRPGLVSNFLGVPNGGDFTDRGEVIYNSSTDNTVDAVFLMGSLYYEGWELKAGVRYEEELNDARAFFTTGQLITDPSISETSGLFPAAVLSRTWGWQNEYQAVFAFSQTTARPTLLERSNVVFFDQSNQTVIEGNPALQNSDVTNFDFAFSFAPTPTDVFRASLFHKQLDRPIISVLERRGQNTAIRNANTPSGTIQGIELEYAKRLSENWTASANYTFLNSQLESGPSPSNENIIISVEDFIGQPTQIFNANIGYNNEDLGLGANLIYNLTGSYPTLFDNVNSAVVERETFHSLDFVLTKELRLFASDGIVKFKVSNLLDEEDTQRYQPSGLTFQSFRPGRVFSLSYSTEF